MHQEKMLKNEVFDLDDIELFIERTPPPPPTQLKTIILFYFTSR